MSFRPKPHISAAVQHSRFTVTVLAGALVLALFLQVVVWAMVHFTDVRTVQLRDTVSQASLQVIHPDANDTSADDATASDDSTSETAEKLAPVVNDGEIPDPNRVPSAGNIRLERFDELVQTVGIVSALALMIALFQAVVIAGGASVPGIEKAVTASTWMVVICLISLPLGRIMPMGFGGVFVSYPDLVFQSVAVRDGLPGAPGAMGYFAWHLIVPFVVITALVMAVLRFRAGVEAGVIVTSLSQLDEKLEQEIRSMKMGQLAAPRSVGALHSAIGDSSGQSPLSIAGGDPPAPTGTDGPSQRRPI